MSVDSSTRPVSVAISERHARPIVGRLRNALYLPLALIAVITAVPFVAMILLALRPAGVVTLRRIFFSMSFTLENFRQVFAGATMARWIANSLVYALVLGVVVLLLASMAGYAFAKKKFWGREAIFWSFIAMLMVPTQATIIPLFILIAKLNGVDTLWGLIVPTLANAQAVFLLRQFIMGIPDELIEAAKLDGASEFRIYAQIILPLAKPILATLAIFVFLWHWNDFLWPLIVSQSDSTRTLTVGLATLQSLTPAVSTIMAAAAISFIPNLLIFLLFQRYLVQSIATTGLKS
jgi:multiple sugar transport system permease protein